MTTHQDSQPHPDQLPRTKVEGDLRRWLRGHFSVIGRGEAFAIGASSKVIAGKLHRGEWATVHRAVYRDTAAPCGPMQLTRAAYVATRGAGVVSHRSAGWLWGILPAAPDRPELSICAAGAGGRRLEGITFHRYADLDVTQAVRHKTVLVTTPPRTIIDLASTLTPADLTDAVDVALARRLVTVEGLMAELDRLAHRGRPGVGLLRHHLLDRGFVGAPPASVLEAKARRLILTLNLPVPVVELVIGDNGEYRLDIAWQEIHLAIEVDGYVWHFSPAHLQRDAARRNRLQQAGWTVLVYTWRDVTTEPARMAREITAAYRRLLAA
jgi:Protein of unknown function (DUF559)